MWGWLWGQELGLGSGPPPPAPHPPHPHSGGPESPPQPPPPPHRVPHSAGTLPNRRALKNARMVSRKDDVHLCVMCLRAIMNYQVGTEVALSLRRVGGQHGDTATI